MTMQEKVSLFAIASATAAVYSLAVVAVFRSAVRLVLRRPSPRRPAARRWGRRVVLALAAAGLACLAYGCFVEPYWLEVTRVETHSARLPPGTPAVRIVQLSDLHCEARQRLEDKLPGVVADLRPDVIVFTGDAINAKDALEVFRRCMRRLAAIAPTFAVRGNWDINDFRNVDLFGGTGVTELKAQAVAVDVKGTRICIEGAPVGDRGQMGRAVMAVDRVMFTVMLYHYGDIVVEAAETNRADLVLAGHTHGGQVALPFYGALITLSQYGKRFEAGLYRVKDTWLYVNRGIGMEGGLAPLPVRFCARPEVTLIEVRPEAASPATGPATQAHGWTASAPLQVE